MDKQHIRNFSIIAHIDHGKSTLADRLLLLTGAISEREFHDQFLDEMDLERERGITIKAKAVRMFYHAQDGHDYLLNLIDTPGHVDFTYEVSKSLKACEGALLVVDASQGVEAQTVANLYMAVENHLTIIPVVNKIDLPQADLEGTKHQVRQILNLPEEEVLMASAKAGTGIEAILEAVVRKVPPPMGDDKNPLQALIFDSVFDPYRGVLVFIRVKNGAIHRGMRVRMMGTGREYEVQELGVFTPKMVQAETLSTGEVGYLAANIREPKDVEVGDTVTDAEHPAVSTLPGYKKVHPMVFCGIYPVNSKDFSALRDAVEKLKLSDASFISEVESSASLGFGLRCGFLGLLHMDIIQERLERGYDLNLVLTTPSVVYQVQTTKGETLEIDNPTKLPPSQNITEISEPFIRAFLLIPTESVGAVMDLCNSRRGEYRSTEYLSEDRVKLVYQLPLSEVLVDFYDKIKSITRGYGSFDYEFVGYVPGKLVKLDILINGKTCDALSSIVHREKAYAKGKALVEKLKELIPRQLFEVALQAAIGSQIISRETVRSVGKAVTSKCYGGDITRKRKLWEKQKAGKQRMKQFGQVQIPQEAFMAILKI